MSETIYSDDVRDGFIVNVRVHKHHTTTQEYPFFADADPPFAPHFDVPDYKLM